MGIKKLRFENKGGWDNKLLIFRQSNMKFKKLRKEQSFDLFFGQRTFIL